MSDVLMDWPAPDVTQRTQRRQLIAGWWGFAMVTLIAAVALVHGFDALSRNASLAQQAAEGSPMYGTSCHACEAGFSLPLPDGRSLAIWALAMGAAVFGWTARRAL